MHSSRKTFKTIHQLPIITPLTKHEQRDLEHKFLSQLKRQHLHTTTDLYSTNHTFHTFELVCLSYLLLSITPVEPMVDTQTQLLTDTDTTLINNTGNTQLSKHKIATYRKKFI